MPIVQPSYEELEAFAQHTASKGLAYRKTPFELRAGGISNWYFDAKGALSNGVDLAKAGELLVAKTADIRPAYDGVTAMGIGGRALALALVLRSERSLCMVEANENKDPNQRYGYGLHGANPEGKELLAVDDTGSTGSSLLKLIDMVEESGGTIHNAVVFVDRSNGRAASALAHRDIELTALYEFNENQGKLLPTVWNKL